MRRALVTGGAGFIGVNLATRLVNDGWAVDLLDNFSRGRADDTVAALCSNEAVQSMPVDLSVANSTDALSSDYDVIFHFAAILGVATVMDRPFETLWRNVQMTIEILRLARRQSALSAFVYASTSEVYAGSLLAGTLTFPTPEDAPLTLPPLNAPRTSYMLSKLYGEALVLQSDVPGIVVRPHNIYGPRMGTVHVIPELMKRISKLDSGGVLPVYSPNHSRTFCYIDDAIEIMLRLAFNPQAIGSSWNVGTEHPEYRMMEVAEIVRSIAGSSATLLPAEDTAGSPSRRCPSTGRTDALTGWSGRISLEEGIARTHQWYSRNGF